MTNPNVSMNFAVEFVHLAINFYSILLFELNKLFSTIFINKYFKYFMDTLYKKYSDIL